MPSQKRLKRNLRSRGELPAPKHNLGFPVRQRQHQDRNICVSTGSEIASWSPLGGPYIGRGKTANDRFIAARRLWDACRLLLSSKSGSRLHVGGLPAEEII